MRLRCQGLTGRECGAEILLRRARQREQLIQAGEAGSGRALRSTAARAMVLTNQRGAVLELSGRQVADGERGVERLAGDYVEVGGTGVARGGAIR